MMCKLKIIILFSFVILYTTNGHTQYYDNVWLFGYNSTPNDSTYGGTVLDFNDDTLDIYYQYRAMNFDITNASIADTSGNLLFYTNGIYIANSEHDTMENGEGLNPGPVADDLQFSGYILDQGAMIIPKPGSDSLFYLFHAPREYPNAQLSWHCSRFYYTLVDMSLNGGLGGVVEKNQVIIDDILTVGQITATKHSNGRDWWILFRKYQSNQYHRILVSPNGIESMGIQEIGLSFNDGVGQAIFSPDGSKYVVHLTRFITEGNLINIYDFDRCTGLLSNPVQTINTDSLIGSGGAAISPNSRYLYLAAANYIYQYDLLADNILATKDTVAIYDGYEVMITPTFGLATRFLFMQTAPDGKIYVNVPNGVNVLHVINNPNEGGEACDVEQHGVELATFNAVSMPNFPNYYLGAEGGSACDTITAIEETYSPDLEVYSFPNPAINFIKFQLERESDNFSNFDILIYDALGKEKRNQKLPSYEDRTEIDLFDFPSGVYFYLIKEKGHTINQGKFIVQK